MATVRGKQIPAISCALAALAAACEPNLVVGTWSCPAGPRQNDGGMLEPVTDPVASPWSTGFEQGFCDYYVAQGFCYKLTNSSYEIVDAPVHSGKHSAAFTIDADAEEANQARCGREGGLPTDAYYGAWYYIPELRDDVQNWNLFHFQSGVPGTRLHPLWDVTLERQADDQLHLYVLGSLGDVGEKRPEESVPVPIGAWFHIEFRLRRAADATGVVELIQDDRSLLELTAVQTDDASFSQWYVGNLADALTPSDSTVYVDDITIRPAP